MFERRMHSIQTRSLLLAVVLAGSALLVSACGGPTGSTIRLDGDPADLKKQYEQEVRANPGDAAALARLGAVLHKLGEHDRAVRYLGRAAGLSPADAEIARWQGEALLGAGRPIDAHREFERALKNDSSWQPRYARNVEPRLLSGLAQQALKGKDVSRVLALVRTLDAELLTRHPKEAAILYEAEGDRLFGAGNQHEAAAAYERSLKTGHSSGDLLFKLGRAHAVLRQLDRANERFTAWIDAVTGADRLARTRAVAELLEQRFLFEQAKRYYEKALKLQPGDAGVRRALGVVLLKGREFDAARAVFDALLAGSKKAELYIDIAQVYLKFRRVDEAIDTWRKAIALSPDDVRQWKVLAHLLKERGRKDEIEAIIGRAERHDLWGDVYMDLLEFQKAAQHYQTALQKSDVDPELWVRLSFARHRLGDVAGRDRALQSFAKAVGDPTKALARIASAYEKVGEVKKASEAWRALAAADPQSRDAAFALARLHAQKNNRRAEAQVLAAWAQAQPDKPSQAASWLEIGRYWVDRRDGARADAAISQSLARGTTPSRRDALLVGAGVHRKLLRNFPRAEELFQRWIEAADPPHRYDARRQVAELVKSTRELRRFRSRLLEDMVAERPDDGRTYYALGESYLLAQPPQPREARRAFERYIELESDQKAAVLKVGRELAGRNAFREAARIYSKLSPEEISQSQLHLELGRLFVRGQVNDKKRARTHLLRYLQTAPDKLPRTIRSQLFRLAGSLVGRGLPEVSVAIYRRLLARERNKTRILKPLGDALLVLGKPDEADEAYRSFLEAMGNNPNAVRQVAEQFYQRQFYKRARVYYESMFNARMRRQLRRHYPRLSQIYRILGDKAGLLDLAKRFVKLSPSATSYGAAATELEQAGLYSDALEFYGQAAEKQPGAHHFREQQAKLALRLGNVEDAERYLQRMISAQRGKAEAWVRAGRLLADQGFDDRALALYGVALEQGADSGPIHLARARVHLRQGQVEKAHADFVRALTRADNLDKVLMEVRSSYLRAGKIERYVDILRRAVALLPGRGASYLDLGEMALRMGRRSEALQHFEKYVAKEPKGLLTVAAFLWDAGDPKAGARYLERAVQSPLFDGRQKALAELLAALSAIGTPKEMPAAVTRFLLASQSPREDLKVLASTLMENGHLEEAIRYYARVLGTSATGDGQLRLGRLWLAVGDSDRAAKAFRRHIEGAGLTAGRRFPARNGPAIPERAVRVAAVATEYENGGFPSLALAEVTDGSRRHPEVGALHVQRARLLMGSGNVLAALGALEGLVRNRIVDPLSPTDLDALYMLVRRLGTEREALDVLRRTSPATRSEALTLALVRLTLRLGNDAEAREEIGRLLGQSEHGALRLEAGLALFDSGRYAEAAELLLEVLEPGRGLASVEPALRTLLILVRVGEDPTLLDSITAKAGRLFEDRRKLHEVMTLTLAEAEFIDEALDHGQQWLQQTNDRPPGTRLFDPNRAHPWRSVTRLHVLKGDVNAALAVGRDYVTRSLNPRMARRNMAQFLRGQMAWSAALQMYEDAISADASDRPSVLAAAGLSIEVGDLDRARKHLDAYVKGGDNTARTYLQVAHLWAEQGLVDDAEQWFSKAAKAELSADLVRPIMWLRAGDEARARKAVEEASNAAADPVYSRVRYAALYFSGSDMPAQMALDIADAVIAARKATPHPVAVLVRAAALAELGRAPAAKKALAAVLKLGGAEDLVLVAKRGGMLGPRTARERTLHLFALKALAGGQLDTARWALDQSGDPSWRGRERAVMVIQDALELPRQWTTEQRQALSELALNLLGPSASHPRRLVESVDRLAALQELGGDLEAALWTYREAIEVFPEQAHLYNNLAYMLARNERELTNALELVQHAKRLNPRGHLAYLDTEGWVLFKLGRYPEARDKIEAAIRHMTQASEGALAESLYHLGAVYQKLGDKAKARDTLGRAHRLSPNSVWGRKAKALLK